MQYDVIRTERGYTLTDGETVYLLNKTKYQSNTASPYYLKQVKPTAKYIAGMFQERKKEKWKGRHYDKYQYTVLIAGDVGYIYQNTL